MNRRLLRKRDLLASGKFPRPLPAPGLFDATGSIALAVGVIRPRVLVDPRAYGEHRALREYALHHEAAHVVLDHTRYLFLARWLWILVAATVFAAGAAVLQSIAACCVAGFVGAWVEARFGFGTMAFRAAAETEADGVALSVMRPEHFAAAVTALFTVRPKSRGLDRWIDGVVYGRDAKERLRRVGVVVEKPKSEPYELFEDDAFVAERKRAAQ